jgi:cyclase
VRKVAAAINIPFTVGGGISSEDDVKVLLENGADKVSVNTSAFKRPELINELASRFGSQCVVVAIDTKLELPLSSGRAQVEDWYVYLNGGKVRTDKKALDWAKECVERGAGEVLLTSMNNDGTKNGFALDITEKISSSVNVPVIASGGAGSMDHFLHAFREGKADAGLAASIFHFGEIAIPDLKKFLNDNGIPMRMTR